jgi:hypothetical protein
MVMHAMEPLTWGGEMDDALRELADIDDLRRHFAATEAGFWEALWPRVEALDLARPAIYGLRHASRLLGTPVPAGVLAASQAGVPAAVVLALMDWIVEESPLPQPLAGQRGEASFARWLACARSHWMKMPPGMLLRDLTQKLVARLHPARPARNRRSAAARVSDFLTARHSGVWCLFVNS